MVELERTYLAKSLPPGLESLEKKDLLDIYIPEAHEHPYLRIRKNGEKYEITKKKPIEDGDRSRQLEQTIPLEEEEFTDLAKLPGKRIHKLRHYLPYENRTAEVDVFQDKLAGLVLVDFEFASEAEKEAFPMPDFYLCEVTQETFLAGGYLAGKSFADIAAQLEQFAYKPLTHS